ncbi:unnamed protein product [Kuraishia capsulata CBS 1993]|uniref:DNA-(apurinic or apyrimidinic site) lyase n=1 Tax=Kuraishia capsulata CBS 1993 TaxID=1382522 RepID=W6MNQ7_9ASCO|nr:uncharacterized protein KUCA_T00004286001 [Kuraishia capsulata CBS 1993]CDK28304.1 unnamed protein product [Kuraishia capsulata CBS 1993]
MQASKIAWKSVRLDPRELAISKVLRCGQAFRWKQIDGIWSCSLRERVVLLKQDDDFLYYSAIFPANKNPEIDDTLEVVTDYFNLNVNLQNLYRLWSELDPAFEKKARVFGGIRMLRQDPWENLVSFICSTNNNVKRISKMCDSLCENYGERIATFQGIDHYSFPGPEKLLDSESDLRELGFGYRAKYIEKTCQMFADDPTLRDQLYDQRSPKVSSLEAHEFLLQFTGVGPKVADCVCLMSLDKHEVVPVDTHVFTFATRDYGYRFKGKKAVTLSKDVYIDIRHFFETLWGDHAGWAHSVLFAADLSDLENGVNIKSEVTDEVKRETKSDIKSDIKREIVVKTEDQVLEDKLAQRVKLEKLEEDLENLETIPKTPKTGRGLKRGRALKNKQSSNKKALVV